MEEIDRRASTCVYFSGYAFAAFVLCSINFKDVYFFGSLPFSCITLFLACFLGVLLLRELASFTQ